MANASKISIVVNGKSMSGWDSVEISRDMDNISGTFAMSHKDLNADNLPMGASCKVIIGSGIDFTMLTGYIDEIESSIGTANVSWQLKGRDRTGDLVDCSYLTRSSDPNYPNELTNLRLIDIMRKLTRRFGVNVNSDSSADAIANTITDFTVNEGDTVADSVGRLCKLNAIMAISIGDGNLTLTRATNQSYGESLYLGSNIISGQLAMSNLERFQYYVLKGTRKTEDPFELSQSFQMQASTIDSTIQRHRPLIMTDSHINDPEEAIQKVMWERSLRAGKSRKYSCVVDGWLQKTNYPWFINQLVKVNDKPRGLDGDTMLVQKTRFTLTNEGGQKTYLDLVDPETYKLIRATESKGTQNKKFDAASVAAQIQVTGE